MPFSPSTLALVTSGSGNAVFQYRNTDSFAVMCAPGYFDAAASQFNAGDKISVTRTGTSAGPNVLRVLASTATSVTVSRPPIVSQYLPLTVTALAATEFTLILPPCTIQRATTITTTAYTGATNTIQLGTSVGGAQIVAAVSHQAVGLVAHTIVAAGAKFAGGTVFIRCAQTTPTAQGVGVLVVEYLPD